MKKILFVIPTLGGGGAEKVLVNLANKLDKAKYCVEIKTLFSNSANKRFLNDGIAVSSIFGRQFKGNRIIFKLFSPEFLFKRLIKGEYDIIVSYLEGPGERIVGGCTNPSTTLINWIHVEQHGFKTISSSYRSTQEFYKCSNRFRFTAFVSERIKELYTSAVKLNHDCGVLYNTNDIDHILSKSTESIGHGILPDGVNLFSVGRLTEAKGFDRLIRAHHRIIAEGIPHNLIILGQGELENSLKQLATSLNVSETVKFLGFQPNPYKFLTHADAFICSSRREGFSTAVTEALILGIPVVSTKVSGATELIGINDEYGILCDNSEEGVYQGMKKLLTTEGLLEKYKTLALKRGKEFSASKTTAKVEELFDTLT